MLHDSHQTKGSRQCWTLLYQQLWQKVDPRAKLLYAAGKARRQSTCRHLVHSLVSPFHLQCVLHRCLSLMGYQVIECRRASSQKSNLAAKKP